MHARIAIIFPIGEFTVDFNMFSGLSIAFMVSADVILMPGEALIKIISVKHQKEYGNVKTAVDASLVVLADDAFVMENAVSLKRMGKYSFLIAFLSILRLFVAFTPATAVIIIVFSIAGLFCFVLCLVFEQAIRYKQENDLTI